MFPNKVNRAADISQGRDSVPSASKTQRIFAFGEQAAVSPRAKTGRREQCEYITVFDAKTKSRAALFFVFCEGYIEMRHAKPSRG